MADRPGLDDNSHLERLIKVWRDGSADIDSRLADVYQEIRAALASDSSNTIRVRRLRLQARRLRDLGRVAEAVLDDLVEETASFVKTQRFVDVYMAGADVTVAATGVPIAFTAAHLDAAKVLADDLFADVLTATDFIEDDAKRFVRRVGRRLTGAKLTSGTPAKAQAKRLERVLSREFRGKGIARMVYRDGSRHSFGEYAEMLIRTKTGLAYNQGTWNQGAVAGIEIYEILDGSLCGLTSHADSQLANGLFVSAETAAAYPLSHPNCRRALNPRPDLNKRNASEAVSVQSEAARLDQTAFEAQLRDQASARTRQRRARIAA